MTKGRGTGQQRDECTSLRETSPVQPANQAATDSCCHSLPTGRRPFASAFARTMVRSRSRGRERRRSRSSSSKSSSSSRSSSSGSSSRSSRSSRSSSSSSRSSSKGRRAGRGDVADSAKKALPPAGRSRSRSPQRSKSRGRSASPRRRRSRSPTPKISKIRVNHLTRNVTKDHVQEIFATYGSIKSVDMPLDRHHHNLSKGFAFIEFDTCEEAEKAIKYMDGGQIDGQEVNVTIVLAPRARPFPDRNRGGGGFGNRGNWRGGRSPPRRRRTPPPRYRGRSPRRSRSRSPRRRGRSSSGSSR